MQYKIKIRYVIVFIVLFALLPKATNSQNYRLSTENKVFNSLEDGAFISNVLTVQQLQTSSQTANNVYINQVGNHNFVRSNLRSESSIVDLKQTGFGNDIYLSINTKKVTENIIQNGNYNRFLDFSASRYNKHNVEVIQKGNNHNLSWFGENSISEKLRITMQGNNKTIIVRNFN